MKANILIIDDTIENLNLLIDILNQEDYTIRPAKSGKIGLQTIEKEQPDIILLDVVMPEMDGFEVCRIIKSNPAYEKIPVIFISALDQNFDKVRAFELGAMDYITKPFNEKEVKKRIDTHIRMRSYQAELEQKNRELETALNLLNEKQAQLIQYEKMASLGVLTAGLAHEIINPINYIHNSILALEKTSEEMLEYLSRFSDICSESFPGNDEIRLLNEKIRLNYYRSTNNDLISSVKEGINRSTNIIRSLHNFSHQDNEKKENVRIKECLDITLLLLAHSLAGITVIKKNLDDLPVIKGNPGRLSQLFMNLLTNAIDSFNEENNPDREQWISIHSTVAEKNGKGYLSITIEDNGNGIPPQIQHKIFDPFFTTKDVGKGVGLGLYIVMAIVKEHSGILEMESIEKKGTVFRVFLPLKTE